MLELFFLLLCADKASEGIGWNLHIKTPFNILAFISQMNLPQTIKEQLDPLKDLLPNQTPYSFCHRIPTDRAIVTPKSVTAQVGHTFRSLSHNLALVEAQPKIEFSWHHVQKKENTLANIVDEHLHILLIPFPYKITAQAITPIAPPEKHGSNGQKYGYFQLNQGWIPKKKETQGKETPLKNQAQQANEIYEKLVLPLIKKSKDHCEIDCIVFPECALPESIADELAKKILQNNSSEHSIRLLITGTASKSDKKNTSYNNATSYFFFKKPNTTNNPKPQDYLVKKQHSKHHRWKLDISQIKRYGFSSFPADTNTDWWESIDVTKRKIPFYAVSPHSCITVLICEDLARNDPAMPTVRAVGPNLIIALLMDGPQIKGRWSAKYAGVLAEDPGSAVLSVTSVAMIDRSNSLEQNKSRSVALWQRPGGQTESIELPKGHHGLVLSLATTAIEQVTMNKVADECNTRRYELMGVEALQVDNPEKWL
ncbi:hypothetical protein [Chromobacterium sp. Beijing]|uniref:hypothetical protein n=1 Tax=Chromobacterium sp. Beijing TaxID=2735795 RepID=UPI001F487890|nr:hypothetical protein [Chromobacterium sp. Beijing]UJB33743.1 hypothetical protein HQN78_23365 [Chromobacterium sp. Beijing]